MKRNVRMRFWLLCSVLLCVLFVAGTAAENGDVEQRSGGTSALLIDELRATSEKPEQRDAAQTDAPSLTTRSLKSTLYAKPLNEPVFGYGEEVDASHPSAEQIGKAVVEAALQKRGCAYVWGGKGDDEFDCSGLVYWAIRKADPKLGRTLYRNAAGQAKYCYDRGLALEADELRPGDLVFWNSNTCEGCDRWREIHHVAIYVGDGQIIDASSDTGCVSVREMGESDKFEIVLFGRPYQ